MAKKAARKTAAKAPAPRKAAKKTAKKKAAGPREAKITFERTRPGNQRPTRVQAASAKLRRGRGTRQSEVITAGQNTKQRGARVARAQKIRDLAGAGGTKFYDRNGKRVSPQEASTQKGNLRSGFQAERQQGGRNLVLVGGGQSG